MYQFQLENDATPYFGEVQYYCLLSVGGNRQAVALVAIYSEPDVDLLRQSHNTLRVCRHIGNRNLRVINVESIKTVVGMVPFPLTTQEEQDPQMRSHYQDCYFVAEKMVLEMTPMDDEDEADDD